MAHSGPESTAVSATNNISVGSAACAGAFFPNATRFNIQGGVFTSNVNIANNVYSAPQEEDSARPGFQRIRLGDIKLVKELRLNSPSEVICRQTKGARRMYSAEIRRDPGLVTVAMYQGDDMNEEWTQDLARYEAIRHPNIMQLYGLMSTERLRAMVFHDELIPYTQFLRRFQHSPILRTYIIGYCGTEFDEAIDYLSGAFQKPAMYYNALPVWMRPTTGELCLDLVQGPPTDFGRPWWKAHILRLDNLLLDDPNAEAAVISNLTEEEYHELCSMPSIAGYWTSTVSTQQPIELGPVIFRSDSSRQTLFKITQALDLDHEQELRWRGCGVREGESLPNFWTRYDSRQACGLHLILLVFRSSKTSKFWMAQANHTFTRLQTISRFEDYVCMNSIEFVFRILPSPRNTQESKGYLFVCPPEDFRTGPNTFQWPDCPAYWSLDPFGDVHLSSEDARDLGFPIIHIETRLKGVSWDGSIYEGLRRFHQIKGFDSDSQDVAKHLEYPLFEQSTEDGATLAFGRAVL